MVRGPRGPRDLSMIALLASTGPRDASTRDTSMISVIMGVYVESLYTAVQCAIPQYNKVRGTTLQHIPMLVGSLTELSFPLPIVGCNSGFQFIKCGHPMTKTGTGESKYVKSYSEQLNPIFQKLWKKVSNTYCIGLT